MHCSVRNFGWHSFTLKRLSSQRTHLELPDVNQIALQVGLGGDRLKDTIKTLVLLQIYFFKPSQKNDIGLGPEKECDDLILDEELPSVSTPADKKEPYTHSRIYSMESRLAMSDTR